MKKIISAVLAILAISVISFIFVQLYRNSPLYAVKILSLKNEFLLEEPKKAVFEVDFLGLFPLGKAELVNRGIEAYQDKQVYHLSARVRSLEIISRFFDAQAYVDSYFDKDKLHSLKFSQVLIIPDKPKDEKEVLFDQKNNIMELKGVRRQILPDTQDPLSAFFYLQRQPLELGKEFDININTNQKNYRLYAKVIKKEEYFVQGKKIGAWVFQGAIRRRDDSPFHSSTISLWLLDNPSRSPILIKAMTNIGLITARIVNLE